MWPGFQELRVDDSVDQYAEMSSDDYVHVAFPSGCEGYEDLKEYGEFDEEDDGYVNGACH